MTANTVKRILVVDDTADVADVTVVILEALGYRAFQATDANTALKMLKADPTIDLLLTDIRMPYINGVELAKRAREMNPDLKVLYSSGYPDLPEEQAVFAAAHPRLDKPYNMATLEATLKVVLST